MECKIKQIKCAVLTIMILVVTFGSFRINAQNTQMQHWYIGGENIDFTSPNLSTYNIANLPNSTNKPGNSNGIYDENGNVIFYVDDGTLYNSNGTNIFTFAYTGSNYGRVIECSIVPVPGNCQTYYVIYSTANESFGVTDHAILSYGIVTVNGTSLTAVNGSQIAGYSGSNTGIRRCGFAVSKKINISGEKYLYVVEGYTSNGDVKRFLIDNSGIHFQSTILSSTSTGSDIWYYPYEVDLSHDGSMLTWSGNNPVVIKLNPQNGNYISHQVYIWPYNNVYGVEFSPDNSRLFIGTGTLIYYVDLNSNNIVPLNYTYPYGWGQLELAYDGKIYCPGSGSPYNDSKSLDPYTLAFGEKVIPLFLATFDDEIGVFPDQIDGYNYDFDLRQYSCCIESNTFTSTLPFYSVTSTWTPTQNPFQNGQTQVSTSAGFTIGSGTKVTISNMIIEFGPEAKVIVEPGATLILDNTTFTSVSCPILWPGVEVWGTYNQSQNQWSGNGLNTYQGRIVVKNSSQINNALTAIQAIKDNGNGTLDWSKTGGIIEAYGSSKFINNRKAIWIGGFKNYMPGHIGDPIYIRPNRSYINYCIFETNNNFNGKMNFHSFIALFDGSLINILNNSFSNNITSSNINIKGTGIISIISPMQVNNNNTFTNLLYGIKVVSFDPSVYFAIDGNSFNTCYYSIFMDHTWGAKITSNSFWIPMKDPSMSKDPFGLYLNGDNAFHVEDNEFNSDFFPGSHGIIATELGAVDNELYKNYFNGLNYGIKPQLQNKGIINSNHVGLKLLCNEFANGNTDYDILVLGQELDEPLGYKYIGIADAQKISDGINYYPAGNIFSNAHSAGTFDLDNGQADYLVYSHENNTAALRFKPDYSSNIGKVHLNPPTNSCPSKLGGGGDLSTQTTLLTQAQTALNSSIVIRNIWKDGGNANLEEEVETTEPWDVYVQLNQLIAESPYLSDEVLMATIENSAFTSLMIKLIMVANPQASHNDEIMQAIYDRIPALPQSYIDEIEAGESTVSQLEILEGNVSADYHLIRSIENSIINIYRLDTINTTAYSSMINLMASRPGLEDRFELASAYLSHSDFTNMNAVLNSIPANFSLDAKQTIEYQNNLTFFAIAQDIRENNLHPGDLSETQTNSLQSIIEQSAIDHSMALSLLLWNNPEYIINELILYKPVSGARKANSTNVQRPETTSLFKLYPNPAHDYFTLQYSNELQSLNQLEIVITDVQGKIIRSIEFEGNIDRLISVDDLLPGVYIVSLYSDKLLLENQKLTILK